ncbi:MAG: BMP family ABC transporter substrate-binding protein [Metamycoplasmataceae bacterium]
MNKSKKLLLGLGGMIVVSTTLLSVVSCSSDSNLYTKTNISGIQDFSKKYEEKINAAIGNSSITAPKTMLITAGGKVNDNSFNQSVWEAVSTIGFQTKNLNNSYYETLNSNDLEKAYDAALSGNYKAWVLTGFQQSTYIEQWLNKGQNMQKIKDNKITIISVDWRVDSSTPKLTKLHENGNIITLNFRTQESAYVIGYSAAEYLFNNYGKDAAISSFGGGVSDGVTNFNNGFLQAILDWNETNSDKKIKFKSGGKNSGTITDEIELNSGFDSSDSKAREIVGRSVNSGAQIILPVAGSLSQTVLEEINKQGSSGANKMIIGVDSNQAVAFPTFSQKIFSSIEKKVDVAVYKVLLQLSVKGALGADDILSSYDGTKSIDVVGGFDLDFVNYSKNTIKNQSEGINAILLKNLNNFYKSGSFEPTFDKDMTTSNDNQQELNELIQKINS